MTCCAYYSDIVDQMEILQLAIEGSAISLQIEKDRDFGDGLGDPPAKLIATYIGAYELVARTMKRILDGEQVYATET
tara:strand:+ start:3305 stop:3535 length:231 start_codon:yes stop_codon:yes gene_type:complete